MNLVKTLKSTAALSAIVLSFVSAPSFATVGVHADAPLSIKTCTRNSAECADTNGPSLDGFAVQAPSGAKPGVCYHDMNGLGLDGFAVPAGVLQHGCHDLNGPSLDGFADSVSQAPSIKTCPSKGNCEFPDQNGPSLNGFDAKLGTVVIAIDKP